MKQVPNIISLFRMFLSLGLLGLAPLCPAFYWAFSLCGLSDMVDGFIARKIGAVSELGSKLDSASDLIFTVVLIWILLPYLSLSKGLILWLLLIALIRGLTLGLGYVKRRTLEIRHTFGNKATGFLLFLSVYFIPFVNVDTIAVFLCLVATLSAVEEFFINLNAPK